MDLYREHLLDHYRHPRGQGLQLAGALHSRASNPLCGDEITVQVAMSGSLVLALRHQGQGCVISQAAASLLSEALPGRSKAEIQRMGLREIEQLLGTKLPYSRIQCGLLALSAIQRALKEKVA